MIPEAWRRGEVAVVGLGKSGVAATTLLARERVRVYASDGAEQPYGGGAAVAALRALPGVTVQVGGHDLARIRAAAGVVASPGVPPDAPPLAAARAARVPIVSELDLGFRALQDRGVRCIAVTGTNGKTTTTALVAQLLQAGGLRAVAAGNIGRPLADVALDPQPWQWLAVEVSSFQLHDSADFAPDVGILTNLAPDHLDRYPSVTAYYADKRLLFRNAAAGSVWVLNGDDPPALALAAGAAGRTLRFSLRVPAAAWYDAARRELRLAGLAFLGMVTSTTRAVGNAVKQTTATARAWLARAPRRCSKTTHTSRKKRRRWRDDSGTERIGVPPSLRSRNSYGTWTRQELQRAFRSHLARELAQKMADR